MMHDIGHESDMFHGSHLPKDFWPLSISILSARYIWKFLVLIWATQVLKWGGFLCVMGLECVPCCCVKSQESSVQV